MEVTRPLLLGQFYLVKWHVKPNILATSVGTKWFGRTYSNRPKRFLHSCAPILAARKIGKIASMDAVSQTEARIARLMP